MGLSTFLTWLAVALQFCGGGAMVMWPDEKWIGGALILIGVMVAIASSAMYLSKNEIIANLKHSWFLVPIGMALGLLMVWVFGLAIIDPHDFVIRDRNELEMITGMEFRNERVVLDGRKFYRNKFHDITFVYDGTTPIIMGENEFSGSLLLISNNNRARSFMALASVFGLCKMPLRVPPGSFLERMIVIPNEDEN